jgi:hypothetical protein
MSTKKNDEEGVFLSSKTEEDKIEARPTSHGILCAWCGEEYLLPEEFPFRMTHANTGQVDYMCCDRCEIRHRVYVAQCNVCGWWHSNVRCPKCGFEPKANTPEDMRTLDHTVAEAKSPQSKAEAQEFVEKVNADWKNNVDDL